MEEFVTAVHINGFVERFFQLMDGDDSGRVSIPQILDAFGKLTCMDKDAKWLAWFEQQFAEVAGEDRLIGIADFQKAFKMANNSLLAERLFTLFDEDNNGKISLTELVNGISVFLHGNEVEKLHFLFRVYDMDGNGYIEFNELHTVLKSCMQENAIRLSDDQIDELTRALFDDADTDNSGSITFEELRAELEKHPGIIENLTLSAVNWLKPPTKKKQSVLKILIPSWMSWKYFVNNWSYVLFVFLFGIALNFFLFIEAAVRHRQSGIFVSVARGCGQCLNFNSVLILVFMMRRSITLLRSSPISNFLPLDQHIDLHKLTGYIVFTFSLLHCLAHIGNFTNLEITDKLENITAWEYLFWVNTPLGWVGGAAGLTGWILLIILMVMFVCALPCVRHKGYFEVFYWTHNLFVFWYIALILHGPNFWKWFLVPATVYAVEWISRLKVVKLARYGRTYIQDGILMPSEVIHLVISRPQNFTYQPGDYVFINIPAIAKYEWHPFTISSAPEQQGIIWLHIRSVGTWTKRLYSFFKKKNEKDKREMMQVKVPKETVRHHSTSINVVHPSLDYNDIRHPLELSSSVEEHLTDCDPQQGSQYQELSSSFSKPIVINVQTKEDEGKGVELFIDGPYGTPSVHIFQAEHAVLIGAGIGVTPFASILQSIMMRYRNAKQVCPRCNHGWTRDIPSSVMRVKKVDFFWINRHQKSFEWFVTLLSQLEMEQSEHGSFDHFLEMHMYMTAALNKTDIKAIGLQMALDLIHEKEKRDLITGLRTRTQAGRPNWDKIFHQLEENRKGKVTIFFCGAPALSRILKQKCVKHGFNFRKENF